MSLIGLSGPHAIGKTTALYRWLSLHKKLYAVIADNQWEAYNDEDGNRVQTRVTAWKGTTTEKKSMVQKLRGIGKVAVIDSVRTTAINFFRPQDHAIFVTCSWRTMERVLKARCERNGKKYAVNYWDERKLAYESHTRYVNCANKYLKPSQVQYFSIEDQARDWPAVDEYFAQLYRKLHNELIRRTNNARILHER